jgi:hypothetical protein
MNQIWHFIPLLKHLDAAHIMLYAMYTHSNKHILHNTALFSHISSFYWTTTTIPSHNRSYCYFTDHVTSTPTHTPTLTLTLLTQDQTTALHLTPHDRSPH